MRIAVLGPLHIECGGQAIEVPAAKERSLLKVLALSAGSIVSTERIIEALWGEAPPKAARKTLQTYVWSIRKLLGEEAVETRPPGYRLALDGVEIDVVDFHRGSAVDGHMSGVGRAKLLVGGLRVV
jgi:DNA-binding SARP family transcriptional activator